VELNHVIRAGMTTYPGLPGPEIRPHLTREASQAQYAPGTEFQIDYISMVGNTGTYLDSPFHRYASGVDLAGLPLSSLADLPIVVARLTGSSQRGIEIAALTALPVAGCAVLLAYRLGRPLGHARIRPSGAVSDRSRRPVARRHRRRTSGYRR